MQKTFTECRAIHLLRFDFYIPSYDLLIEYHGGQHYKVVDFYGGVDGFETRQKYDKIKEKFAVTNHNFLVIPHWKFKDMENIILAKIQENNNE